MDRNFGAALTYFFGFASILLALCVSCSPRLTSIDSPIGEVQNFTTAGKAVLEDRWWTVFEDDQLNRLIDSALLRNFDLAATWEQFRAANAVVSREASGKWPQIEGNAQTAENFPENDFRGGENTQLGLSASYEIDLWGRIKTAVQAEKFRAEASL